MLECEKCGSILGVKRCKVTDKPVCIHCRLAFKFTPEQRERNPQLPEMNIYFSFPVWRDHWRKQVPAIGI